MFTTDRLILREWRATDVTHFQRIWNDKRCQNTLSNTYNIPIDVDRAKELIGLIFRAPGTLLAIAITLKPISAVSGETVGSSGAPTEREKSSEEDTFVGWIIIRSTNAKNRDGDLGIAVHPDYWNKGYGTEAMRFVVDYAFREMNLHRVSLEVFEGNDRAKRVYNKVGFKVEGVRKKVNWVNGKWRDVTLMAIIDEEYWAEHRLEED